MVIHIDDPWFEFIKTGRKTVEGKLAKGKALLLTSGSVFSITSNRGDILRARVKDVRRYSSFSEYLIREGLDKTLPDIPDLASGLEVYARYFAPGLDVQLGVLALDLEVVV